MMWQPHSAMPSRCSKRQPPNRASYQRRKLNHHLLERFIVIAYDLYRNPECEAIAIPKLLQMVKQITS